MESRGKGGGGGADGSVGGRKLKLAYLRAAGIKDVEVRKEIK